jgi:CheY-like chemotaxis protein
MRQALADWLREGGYPVWVAEHGGRALELYRSLRGQIALVLLDVWMPGLDGPATLRALREVDAQVRCCFITGGFTRYTEEQLLGEGAVQVMMKPPSWDQLRSVLAGSAGRRERPPAPGPNPAHSG